MTRSRYAQSFPRAFMLLVVMLAAIGPWPRMAAAAPTAQRAGDHVQPICLG